MKPCLGIEQARPAKAKWEGDGTLCGKDSMTGTGLQQCTPQGCSDAHRTAAMRTGLQQCTPEGCSNVHGTAAMHTTGLQQCTQDRSICFAWNVKYVWPTDTKGLLAPGCNGLRCIQRQSVSTEEVQKHSVLHVFSLLFLLLYGPSRLYASRETVLSVLFIVVSLEYSGMKVETSCLDLCVEDSV